MLELTLCNELLAGEGHSLSEQARIACALGYMGLEIAPSTLGTAPHLLDGAARHEIRESVRAEGIRITGLHWLLADHPHLSITDSACKVETRKVLIALTRLCADLGGTVVVHGSPKQRRRPSGMTDSDLLHCLADFFAPVAREAERCGVRYCIEPLSPAESNVITSVAEGVALVEAVGSPAFRTMIDVSAAGQVEPPVADLLRRWIPTGMIGHIHANETTRGAPGTGNDPFPDIVAAILEAGWDAPVGVEPFRTVIDARVTAAIGAATLRACERAAA